MANVIKFTNVKPTNFVMPTSRYASSRTILYGEEKVVTFNTYKRSEIPSTSEDMFLVIPPGEEYRPDLTSYRAYNTVDLWWQIMQANNIFDVFEYKSGLNIRIPSPYNFFRS